MRWGKTTLRNSFFGWIAHQGTAEPSERLEDIRKAMLQLLDQSPNRQNSAIERRVLFAHNLDELWYARPDLMTCVAAACGEAFARDRLADITRMFDTGAGGKQQRGRNGPGKA